ncbi:MAG: ATP-dependent Clp protease, ATP-binding subunit ClpC, partial [uncultured Solirubrobacteraceae bacterium]
VRALHRTGPARRRPSAGGGPHPPAQRHRHRAHPARPAPREGGSCRACARVAQHHRRARARAGGPDRRLGRGIHLRADPLHTARQEGARAGAARGPQTRAQLHRHRAHAARDRARERGRRGANPARLRRRLREDPRQGDHPHALGPRRASALERSAGHRRLGARRRLGQRGQAARSGWPLRRADNGPDHPAHSARTGDLLRAEDPARQDRHPALRTSQPRWAAAPARLV